MDIIRAYAVNNLCYKSAIRMTPVGIIVHSTGANNPNLKRYVDCPDELGKNLYGNHWNTAKPGGKNVCVHAFIGYDKKGEVRVAEILPLDVCCWGVGEGKCGSYNYDPPHIQFEICEDALNDRIYYGKAFGVAAEYCAYLCKLYGLSTDSIISHKEAHARGYGSNHSDPVHWMKKFGETMDDFRKKVDLLMKTETITTYNPNSLTNETVEIKDGDLVSIAKEAMYYTGKYIPGWVKSMKWYVSGTPKGDRAVIDKNEEGTFSICSPINVKYLKVEKSGVSTTRDAIYPYLIQVQTDTLNIREFAGIDSAVVGSISDRGVYTIVQEATGNGAKLWGKLKSGVGWISLDYVKKI